MSTLFLNIGSIVLCITGCVSTQTPESPEKSVDEIHISGRFLESTDCNYKLVVDVLVQGESKPIDIPEVSLSGDFAIQIASQHQDSPLHVQGFCYASDEDFAINSSSWQTEPISIVPSELDSFHLELRRNWRQSEPVIQESIVTEWSTLLKHPKWVQFYGLRHPDNLDRTAGTVPEIRGGGLTTTTHCTHSQALYGKVQQASSPDMRPLLLPPSSLLEKACNAIDPMDIQIQILQQHLINSCRVLKLSCPSVNILRMQAWIPSNKAFVSGKTQVIERAQLWLLFQHLVTTTRLRGLDPINYVPNLQSPRWKEQCTTVQKAYQHFEVPIPTASQQWFKDCLDQE